MKCYRHIQPKLLLLVSQISKLNVSCELLYSSYSRQNNRARKKTKIEWESCTTGWTGLGVELSRRSEDCMARQGSAALGLTNFFLSSFYCYFLKRVYFYWVSSKFWAWRLLPIILINNGNFKKLHWAWQIFFFFFLLLFF